MKNKIALAMICKGSKKESIELDRCLKYISPYVDDIFITINNGDDYKSVEEICKNYKAKVSYFEWCNDFSKARNYNFKQVPKSFDYIAWFDADDAVRNADKIRETIKDNPDVDIFQFMYLYSFDEEKNPVVVHPKGRIIRNDGCVEWAGALHEDFKLNRKVNIRLVEGIDVLHLSNEERFERAKVRNLEVAEAQMKDLPNDPRSYWNLGNALKALLRDVESVQILDKFIEMSKSEDEKYIAFLRIAESYWNLGNKKKAIKTCKYAIGTKPNFPDAYHLLGDLYLEMNMYKEAIEQYLHGLHKKPPYDSILVFNPRDYDYRPMMNMAKAYFSMHLPTMALPLLEACVKIMPSDQGLKEKVKVMRKESNKFDKVAKFIKKLKKEKDKKIIKAELDKIDPEMQSHPAICNLRNTTFIKKKSSGKDIVFYCGYTAREWTPESLKEGIGGSEEAIIHLAQGLSDKGWNVTVYNNCGYKQSKHGDVTYKPFWSWNYRDKQDVAVIWRHLAPLDYEINADKVFVDLHDVIQPGELNEKRMERCAGVFVKSKFHRSLFPDVADNKFIIVPNGIISETFEGEHKKDPMLMINTSSPDRSLRALIDCFKEVKKEVPEAKCKWCYGWGVWDAVYANYPEKMQWKEDIQRELKEVGIEEMGMISHEAVANLYKKATILAYPSEFAEIDCISLTKALASDCIPVTTTFSAMGEKSSYGGVYIESKKDKDNWCINDKFDFSMETGKEEWVKEAINILKENKVKIERDKVLKDYNWTSIVTAWNNKLKK